MSSLVIGGGLAGLAAAVELHRSGYPVRVLEASDDVGGRVRTDHVDGFLVDRGFQVLLTSYPEARRALDFAELDLGTFHAGALVRSRGRFVRVGDPRRRPADAFAALAAPVGTLADKVRVLGLGRRLARLLPDAADHPVPDTGRSTLDELTAAGFSRGFINRFFRPFLGGIFLERQLASDAARLADVWRFFQTGFAALPRDGMGAIATQLRAQLPPDAVRLDTRVRALHPAAGDGCTVTLDDGERLEADAVILAVDGSAAARLLDRDTPVVWNGVAHYAFDAPRSPVDGPWLVLGGDEDGPINNLCVPSQASPSYAPAGRHLVSVSVLDATPPAEAPERVDAVRTQLASWFGRDEVDAWRLLRATTIPHAVPAHESLLPTRPHASIWVCGDHLGQPSIQQALASGRRAARLMLTESVFTTA